MRMVIRRGCFETNSSSMHSICVGRETGVYTPEEATCGEYLSDDGKLRLMPYELTFGRSFNILCTFFDKCRFAIASLEDDTYVRKIATEFIPGFSGFELPTVWVKDEDGVEQEVSDYGYIDTQSVGLLQRFLEKRNVSLKDFLTRREYYVVIDGDEYCIYDKMLDMGVVNITDRFPAYGGGYEQFNKERMF